MALCPCTRESAEFVQDDHVLLARDVAFDQTLYGESVDGIPEG